MIEVKTATAADLDWLDKLFNSDTKSLGWSPRVQIMEAIKKGEIVHIDKSAACKYHKRKDGWVTIYTIISKQKGLGGKLFEHILSLGLPVRLKCPVDLPSNQWYEKRGGTLAKVEPGKKRNLNVWVWDKNIFT